MKSTLVCVLLFFILLSILFFSFNSSLKELMSQADKDKMNADMGKSQDEIAKKSGTSQAQEMENLKKKNIQVILLVQYMFLYQHMHLNQI